MAALLACLSIQLTTKPLQSWKSADHPYIACHRYYLNVNSLGVPAPARGLKQHHWFSTRILIRSCRVSRHKKPDLTPIVFLCLHLPVPGFGPHPFRFSDQLLWSCHHKRSRMTGEHQSLRYSVANLRQIVFGKTGHFHDGIAVNAVLQHGTGDFQLAFIAAFFNTTLLT